MPDLRQTLTQIQIAAQQKGASFALQQALTYESQFNGQFQYHALLASLFQQVNQVDSAIKNYDLATSINSDPDLMFQHALLLERLGQTDNALSKLDALLKIRQTEQFSIRKLYVLLGANKTDEAETYLSELKPRYKSSDIVVADAQLRFSRGDVLAAYDTLAESGYKTSYNVSYNLGVYAFKLNKFLEGIEHLKLAIKNNPKRPEPYSLMSDMFVMTQQLEQGLAVLEQGLQNAGGTAELLRKEANLKWESGDKGHLNSYRNSWRQLKNLNVDIDYFAIAMRTNSDEDVAMLAKHFEAIPDKNTAIALALYEYYYVIERFDKAIDLYRDCSARYQASEQELDWCARHLMALDLWQEAKNVVEHLLKIAPENQGYWCVYSTVLRKMDIKAYEQLMSFDELLFEIDLKSNLDKSYLENLCESLKRFHVQTQHPISQSLVTGTQTLGRLFQYDNEYVKRLESVLHDAIAEQLKNLPLQPQHPTKKYAGDEFSFSGAWSVRLKPGGFHKNHYHSEGWYSGVIYLDFPEFEGEQGGLKIGEPELYLRSPMNPERIINPEVGKVVLFPSFYWHGTVPFSNQGHRLTVAFDLVPSSRV